MNRTDIKKKKIIIFLVIAFGLGWILQITSSVLANSGNPQAFGIINMIVMYMPFLGVLIAGIPLKGMGWIPHFKGKIRYLLIALWAPALLGVIGGALFFAICPNAFDSEFSVLRGAMEDAGMMEQLEAQGLTMQMYLIQSAIVAVTYGPLVNILVTLGEEVGWRGVMYPYLKEKLGATKGRILGGTIWGVWHWPLMILAGYEYGKEYLGAPVLGPVLFCITTIVLGILLDYVYEKTGNILIPALMHGAINAVNTTFVYLIKPEYTDINILGPASNGIISMIPLMIMAVIICVKQRKKSTKQTALEEQTVHG